MLVMLNPNHKPFCFPLLSSLCPSFPPRVLQATSTSFVDTLKAVIGDVKYFLAFLVLTFYSFAAAFHILFRKDQKEIEVRRAGMGSGPGLVGF